MNELIILGVLFSIIFMSCVVHGIVEIVYHKCILHSKKSIWQILGEI